MREALLAFLRDALLDQGTVAGNRMEIVAPRFSTEFTVKVWVREDGPPEYYTVKVTKNL